MTFQPRISFFLLALMILFISACDSKGEISKVPEISFFRANPVLIETGNSSTLSWTTNNADKVLLEPGFIDLGEETHYVVSPLVTTQYTLIASNKADLAKKQLEIEVKNTASGIDLTVNLDATPRPISPYIYGLNFATEEFAKEISLPVRRWGGNAVSRYNWQNQATNLGSDWYFENVGNFDPYIGINETADRWIAQNKRSNTESLLTLPITGFVAKDKISCGFSVDRYGVQEEVDPSRRSCGNGTDTKGKPITSVAPEDTSLFIDPTFITDWIKHLSSTFGSALQGGISFYALDNEPELWSETHRDIHPEPLGYDELWQKSLSYALAVKTIEPEAQIFGYASFGWSGYWYSTYDLVEAEKNGYSRFPDYEAHGDRYQLEWYLQQMKAAEAFTGKRLLDYLDVHFYPQNGVALTLAGDEAKQDLRLRSTRALWDESYRDESWIGADDQTETMRKVNLIPRLKAWVDENYPGTKLALTEYNWGGLEHINGALVQADILGIFGREGLNFATLWNYPDRYLGYDHFADLPGAYAFRIYRNYDGAGNQFGDLSLPSSSSDEARLALYAAKRSNDGAITLVIINKSKEALNSRINLNNHKRQGHAEVYRYSAANPNQIVREADAPITDTDLTVLVPPQSLNLLVLKP